MVHLSRRAFLMLGTGLAVAACTPAPAPRVTTINDLTATTPFYIAHRGSGDNWPEHTAAAYRNAVQAGATALEVSVHATSDGVLVCHHDANLLRMTGVDADIATVPYADVKGMLNNARAWLGPRSLLLPIPTLKEVLDEHAAQRVIFIEDKQGTNTEALLDLMDSYPNPTDHFIWKQPATSERYRLAQTRGYTSWGYFSPEEEGTVEDFAHRFDYLGVATSAGADVVAQLVASGKPVICAEVHNRSVRDTMVGWGVRGIMCANYPYVTATQPLAHADSFATGERAAGDLPAVLAWERQPTLLPETAAVRFEGDHKGSYCMGSLTPITAGTYTLAVDLAWPEEAPADYEHAGVAFGQADDGPYLIRDESPTSGYHFVLRGDGSLELFVRSAGTVSGQSLGEVATAPPVVGVWMSFVIHVSPNELRLERTDGAGWELRVQEARYRGGYFSLSRNYDGGPAVHFRSVSVRMDGPEPSAQG